MGGTETEHPLQWHPKNHDTNCILRVDEPFKLRNPVPNCPSAVQGFTPSPLQRLIVVVQPIDQQLDRAAGVEAGGSRIGERELLDLERLFMQLRPLASDQGVLGVHRPEDCAIPNANESGVMSPSLGAAPGNQH